MNSTDSALKNEVRDFWEKASCGEVYAKGDSLRQLLESQAKARYELEPYILEFARFAEGAGRDVLEIGVGMGADHLEWARARPRSLAGIDITPRGVAYTRSLLELYGFTSRLQVGDAENLPFASESFDLVYSWGVLHHTPDTPAAVREVWRVLRRNGVARVMIYHARSIVGGMLWARYGLMAGRPARALADIYAHHLESPGTKAYSIEEARRMFSSFSRVEARSQLSFGDLLEGAAGQRHTGALLSAARALWPRPLIKRLLPRCGLLLLIEAVK